LPEARKATSSRGSSSSTVFRYRSQIGFADFNDEIFKQLPPVAAGAVRIIRHRAAPAFTASHASHIIGWPVEKGRPLIRS